MTNVSLWRHNRHNFECFVWRCGNASVQGKRTGGNDLVFQGEVILSVRLEKGKFVLYLTRDGVYVFPANSTFSTCAT